MFDRDGVFERFTFFDTDLIERLFRAEVLRLLKGRGLISQDVVDNLLSWPHSGFSVHGDVRVPDRDGRRPPGPLHDPLPDRARAHVAR